MKIFSMLFFILISASAVAKVTPKPDVVLNWNLPTGKVEIHLSGDSVWYDSNHMVTSGRLSQGLTLSTNLGSAVIHEGTFFETGDGSCSKSEYCFDAQDGGSSVDVNFIIENQKYVSDAGSLEVLIGDATVTGISDVYNNPYGPVVNKKVNGVLHSLHPMRLYPDGSLSYGYVGEGKDAPHPGLSEFIVQNQPLLAHSVGIFPNGQVNDLYLDRDATLKTTSGHVIICHAYYSVSFDINGLASDNYIPYGSGGGCSPVK